MNFAVDSGRIGASSVRLDGRGNGISCSQSTEHI